MRLALPVDELVILGHAWRIVARSACYYGELAGHAWPRHLRKIVFLGTPHHGTAFERGGNWVTVALGVSRYTRHSRAWARSAAPASPTSATAAFWTRLEYRDRYTPQRPGASCRCPTACNAMPSARRSRRAKTCRRAAPRRRSRAVAQRARPAPRPGPEPVFPESQQWIGYGMNHWDLLNRGEVYEQVRGWVAGSVVTCTFLVSQI